jgi:LysM repeat protein
MTRLLLAFCLLFCGIWGFAQVAPQATYVLFNNQNMDILDYRLAFSTNTTQYYAYNFKPGGNDQYILYSGSGVNLDNLPNNTQNSRDFKLTDDLTTGINNVSRQLFIVVQQQRGYVVSPITKVTKVTNSGKYIFMNAFNYSYVFDTDNISMGRELSTAGSGASVTLTSFGYKNCKYQYSFKRTPNVANAESAEFDFVPGIGITSEKSGRNATEMQNNQVVLWAINGLTLSDYIGKECGNTTATTPYTPPTPVPSPGNVVPPIDPRIGDPATGNTQPTQTGTLIYTSAISKYPAVNCGKAAGVGMHIVQPKETVNSIARFYGVTSAQILKWNGIKDANKISVCQELQVAAPGGTVKKGLQPIIAVPATQANTGVNVTPPPAQPNNIPPYTPVQPIGPTAVPDLFGGGQQQGPTYIAPQPTIQQSPTTPAPQTVPNNNNNTTGQFYSVKQGEGLAAIARKFGYTEERLRNMNKMPATGNVGLQVGQKLKVSDCDNGNYYTSPTETALPSQGGVPVFTQPVGNNPTNLPTGVYQPLPPVNTGVGGTPVYTPVQSNYTPPVITTPEPPKTNTKRDPIGFKDYFVKDSETIKDIARKQSMDAAELALINGRDQNEKLAPGTRIQLPIY